MAFFKRKESEDKSELPQLPGLPEMPALPALPDSTTKSEIRPLPTFPRSPMGDSLGLGAIKTSIESPNKPLELNKPNTERRTIELSDINSYKSSMPPIKKSLGETPKEVFVKLDKFQDAVKKFEEIKQKVNEIESSLNEIRQIKDKEENELKSWEQEVQIIKDKVSNIDSSLFNKI